MRGLFTPRDRNRMAARFLSSFAIRSVDMPKVLENVRSAQIPVPVYEPITLPDLESRADVRDIHPLRCFDHLLIVIVLYTWVR